MRSTDIEGEYKRMRGLEGGPESGRQAKGADTASEGGKKEVNLNEGFRMRNGRGGWRGEAH